MKKAWYLSQIKYWTLSYLRWCDEPDKESDAVIKGRNNSISTLASLCVAYEKFK